MKTSEYRLSRADQRVVITLGREQTRLVGEMQEVQAAIDALAARYAADFALDLERGRVYFEQRGEGVILIWQPFPEKELPPEGDPDPHITFEEGAGNEG